MTVTPTAHHYKDVMLTRIAPNISEQLEMSLSHSPQSESIKTWLNQSYPSADSIFVVLESRNGSEVSTIRLFEAGEEEEFTTFLEDMQTAPTNTPANTLVNAGTNTRANTSRKTRIIVMVHSGFEKVDTGMLKALDDIYHIDHLFLYSHFYWDCRGKGEDEEGKVRKNESTNEGNGNRNNADDKQISEKKSRKIH